MKFHWELARTGQINKIGIVGLGFVGSAILEFLDSVHRRFSNNPEFYIYDINTKKTKHTLEQIVQCDVVFVCLPTPLPNDVPEYKSLDISALEDFFSSVQGTATNYVLKSTVPIGTTSMLAKKYKLPNLCHSPEFLSRKTARQDLENARMVLVGCPKDELEKDERECYMYKVESLYAKIYYDKSTIVAKCTSNESELIKLATNAFYTVKNNFFNLLYELTNSKGLSYKVVRNLITNNHNISDTHTMVPGDDGKFGFGGPCLPKDSMQFTQELINSHMDTSLMEAILMTNLEYRDKI